MSIIQVEDVSMRFNLAQEKTETLKEYTVKLLKHQLFFNEFYALRDISFKIEPGESVALIGRNGSGKSTMLKLIAGVMYPTTGSVTVNGEIAPLIELGAGFDLDLTARENVFLNGAVLGHDRAYMQEHFQNIIDFAELWDFVDVPVKNYSSGMIARLGFSIATEVRADILACDEILSVGDFMFQQKCHQRMEQMLSGGTTLLFVSHDINQVKQLCKRAIWIDHGHLRGDGPAEEVCNAYVEAMQRGEWPPLGGGSRRSGWGREPCGDPKYFGLPQALPFRPCGATSPARGGKGPAQKQATQRRPHADQKTKPYTGNPDRYPAAGGGGGHGILVLPAVAAGLACADVLRRRRHLLGRSGAAQLR